MANVAVMALSASMVTARGLVEPAALPLQPTQCQPASGVAVRVTPVPDGYDIRLGSFTTLPLPWTETVSV